MNNDSQSYEHPRWLRAWLAVFTAIAAFRVARLAFAVLFFCIETNGMGLPRVIIITLSNFLHSWDSVIVQGISVAIGVLAARWVESKFLKKSRRAALVVSLVFTGLSCFPISVGFGIQPVMVSPLEIAIHDHYSLDTTEAIIDRYPHLINGSHGPWGPYQPLADAAEEGETNLVALLVRKGADVDAAVASLQRFKAEREIKLILNCAEVHRSVIPTNKDSSHR